MFSTVESELLAQLLPRAFLPSLPSTLREKRVSLFPPPSHPASPPLLANPLSYLYSLRGRFQIRRREGGERGAELII